LGGQKIILTDTNLEAFYWLLQKTIFITIVQCSQGVLCIVQERSKIIRSS